METSLNVGIETTGEDTLTRHSSKLSLGSSPSVLSGDEEGIDDDGLEDDPSDNGIGNSNSNSSDDQHHHHQHSTVTSQGMDDHKQDAFFGTDEEDNDDYGDQDALTPTNMIMDEDDDGMIKTRTEEQGDDDGDDINNLSNRSLPPSTSDLDDINMENDSASPLSSVPDDFPLSPDTQDDSSPLLSPTHAISDSQSSITPLPPSPVTRRQKQQQQLQTTSTSSLPAEKTGSVRKRKSSLQGGGTTLSSNTRQQRRSRNQGGQYQALDNFSGNSVKNKEHGIPMDDDSSTQVTKSRRVSIIGHNFYNNPTINTKTGTNVEKIEEEEDDKVNDDDNDNDDDKEEDGDDNKMDETANIGSKQIPLTPTKHHNSTEAPTHLPKIKATLQHSSKDGGDNGQQDTDNNNEEKENTTPMTSNRDNSGTSGRNDFSDTSNTTHTSTFEDSERIRIPRNEEERDDQQQHKAALNALTHIEVEFARLRDKLYQERMAELNEEAMMIENGTLSNLVTLMTEIEEKKDRRISTAEAWRKYQHINFKRQYESLEYQANVHFISRKAAMRREVLAETNEKRWRLEDEHGKLNDLSRKYENLLPDTDALVIRKQGKREETMVLQDIKDAIGFPRAAQVSGLSSQDIRDDLLLLGLGTSRSRQ